MTVSRNLASRTGAVLAAAVLLGAYSAGARGELNCNVGIEFHPAGGIKSCRLNGNHTLQTAMGIRVTCADGEVLEKYPEGRLKSCTLAEPAGVDATRCDARARIEFDPDGDFELCTPT